MQHIRLFYVLLTVHLITIFVNNQLDAQFLFLYLFIPILYMFRTRCSSSGESIVSIRPLVCHSGNSSMVCVGDNVRYAGLDGTAHVLLVLLGRGQGFWVNDIVVVVKYDTMVSNLGQMFLLIYKTVLICCWLHGVLCNLSCALSMGGGFFCVRNFICHLSIIRLHSCIVSCRSLWYLLAGPLGSVRKLLVVRKVCILLEYSSEFMNTVVLSLSACVIIAFSVACFCFNCFITCSCLFWIGLFFTHCIDILL